MISRNLPPLRNGRLPTSENRYPPCPAHLVTSPNVLHEASIKQIIFTMSRKISHKRLYIPVSGDGSLPTISTLGTEIPFILLTLRAASAFELLLVLQEAWAQISSLFP
jgi:hypothetical protein